MCLIDSLIWWIKPLRKLFKRKKNKDLEIANILHVAVKNI